MKIQIATDYERVVTRERDIDLPTEDGYYRKVDDGRFFPVGVQLFAILTKYANSYRLVYVESNKQDFNDFVPLDDCRSEFWPKTSGLRKKAFDIFLSPLYFDGWTKITKEEFDEERIKLLNNYQR